MKTGKMQSTKAVVGGFAIVAAGVSVGLVLGFAVPAGASAPAPAVSAPASIVENGKTFITSAGVDSSWHAVTSAFPQPLPSTVQWPADAPAFFKPTGGGARDLYEPQLFATIAARFWRCAWLDEGLQGNSAAASKLARYGDLPGSNAMPITTYLNDMSAGAKSRGVSENKYEFSVDCGLYTEAGYGR